MTGNTAMREQTWMETSCNLEHEELTKGYFDDKHEMNNRRDSMGQNKLCVNKLLIDIS